jgi:hypothetical protein
MSLNKWHSFGLRLLDKESGSRREDRKERKPAATFVSIVGSGKQLSS